jgi:hypothetical protein
MATQLQPETVTLADDGTSDNIDMGPGVWSFKLHATSWDAGNPVTVEFADSNVEARFEPVEDPATGSALSRVANSLPIIIEHGGGHLRINAETLGTTTGLSLTAKFVRG